jgi:hypothetical protein
VLITYLLVSASFISIGVFDVGIATAGDPPPDAPAPPPVTVSLRLEEAGSVRFALSGGEERIFTIPAKEGRWDFEGVVSELNGIHARWAALDSALVAADTQVQYRDVVKAIESVKRVFPAAYIGEQQRAE